MKSINIYCLTAVKLFEDAGKTYVIAKNEEEAREKEIKAIMSYENSKRTEKEELYTKEEIEDLYSILDIEQIPDEIDGYKITLTKI